MWTEPYSYIQWACSYHEKGFILKTETKCSYSFIYYIIRQSKNFKNKNVLFQKNRFFFFTKKYKNLMYLLYGKWLRLLLFQHKSLCLPDVTNRTKFSQLILLVCFFFFISVYYIDITISLHKLVFWLENIDCCQQNFEYFTLGNCFIESTRFILKNGID